MIRHSQKNDNKKNVATLREKIISLIAKHARYPRDLYDACACDSTLTPTKFRDLLNEMHRDGDIHINTDNRVILPKPSPETKSPPAEPPASPVKIENSPDDTRIHFLVNRSRVLKDPKQKKYLDNRYYAHKNYKPEQIPLNSVCEETLLKGYQFVPGEFIDKDNTGIRTAANWKSQQLFLVEFDDTAEKSLDEFIEAHPFVKENAWLVTESLRSRYDDPNDPKCNGQLRVRAVFCLPVAVTTTDERQWIYDALEKEMPDCDDGSANSITNGGLGKANTEHIKIGKIVDIDWLNTVIATGRQKKAEADKTKARAAEERERKKAERAAKGHTERAGEIPLDALAKSDPSLFLESLGLSLKSKSEKYQHWGRTEKQGDTALSVWLSDHGNYQIRVFANSIPVPLAVNGAMPFTRFYCYHELQTDTEGMQPDSQQWKDLNAELARLGYGTWLSDEDFKAKHTTPTQTSIKSSNHNEKPQPVRTLPPDHPLLISAPAVEVRESPSFPYFSKEGRDVVSNVLLLDPNAGWHGQTPVFTNKYEYLYPLTNKFARNGQPSEVEKRRVWSTLFGSCGICGAATAQWIDRYLLTAGLYCDGCHKDYHLGSYLEIELNRKLPNSIVSDYQGFLGDDPEFADFRLWQPRTLTHLGAAMSTGKTTEIDTLMTTLAIQGLGKGIIAVPQVALARFLAHYLRRKHGYRSWGLWHEGCHKSEKFIGNIGAIVCLPSLPQAVRYANDAGVQHLYIAIDEVDFGYNLLSLSIEQATAVKKCLRDALNTTGLVVSGQTESTLSLEALAEELECEERQGFYNTAPPADGHVLMHKYPNIEGKANAILCGVIDEISDVLFAGCNAYVFCSSRRDGDIIADVFQCENPVIYNAYTKGDPRADAFLRNQRLTDSRLFIGTSAAGIGISILDPNARTIIATGLNYGSLDASMLAQEDVRDRGRCGVSYHYTEYNLPLPIRPTENEEVSIYHEALKAAASPDAHLPDNSIRKIARSQALASLADTQIETFISHHLGSVGNMPVYNTSALVCEPERIAVIASRRSETRRVEREKRITTAVELLNQRDILTTSGIRKLSNKGALSPEMRLAHETVNAVVQAVGWDDKTDSVKDVLNTETLNVAIRLAEENINVDQLTKQRRGYLAASFPKWTANQFKSELEKSDAQSVIDGLGIEITAIHDDRVLGEILSVLLKCFIGKAFDTESLAEAVREVLKMTCSTGDTFLNEITSGALGASAYRKARFLHIAGDDRIMDWIRAFLSQWYPARIAKNKDTYVLTHAENVDLRLAAFSRWLMHQPSVPDGTQIDLDIFEPTELPDPDAELKNVARSRREAGETIKAISESLSRNRKTIAKWCEGINPLTPVQRDVLELLSDGKVWKTSDIVVHSQFVRRNVMTALKKLSDADKIRKIKRGLYQTQK
ncbi:MAG: hypothetical protein OXH00_21685 [Candidatus Poribacteria bacterium]|nr:hypothetical protein [Candidatus Poribacteria bacterium]